MRNNNDMGFLGDLFDPYILDNPIANYSGADIVSPSISLLWAQMSRGQILEATLTLSWLRPDDFAQSATSPHPQMTFLHTAIQLGAEALAVSLIEKGIPLAVKDALGNTPLHYAIQYQQETTINLLLERGRDLLIHELSNEGLTPINFARTINHPRILYRLHVAEIDFMLEHSFTETNRLLAIQGTEAGLYFERVPAPPSYHDILTPVSQRGKNKNS